MSPTSTTPAAVKTRFSVDEFWEFTNQAENADRLFELRNGEVVEMSRPTTLHGIVAANIGADLTNYARRIRRGYVTVDDAGVVLDETAGTVVGPDVAYFTGARTFRDVTPKWSERPPVLAVEVTSPNDKMGRVLEKVNDYLRTGVRVVWLVDYETQTVTVFRSGQNHAGFKEPAELTGDPELPGFACPVRDFFILPEEKPTPPAA